MTTNNRRIFLKKAGAAFAIASISFERDSFIGESELPSTHEIYFTNGIKIAEVGPNSAIIWTRLCADKTANPVTHQRREEVFRHPINFNEEANVADMDGAVKGIDGKARVIIKGEGYLFKSKWQTCSIAGDHTVRFEVTNLLPKTKYEITWEAKSDKSNAIFRTNGSFTTAPNSNTAADIKLVTSTCQYFWSFDDQQRGFQSYDSMRKLNPDFFIHTGDYVYYDKPGPLAKNKEKARHKWHAMNSWPALRDLFANTPTYMIKDDHDVLIDDVDPTRTLYGDLTYNDGLTIWRENAPIHDLPYRTIRWGKHLQIWLVEGREYRSINKSEDGPSKSIFGKKQKEWLADTVSKSDATFKLLFSATPVVGPDRPKKIDNHANDSYGTEGRWLRNFIAEQKNMFVVNGDRHWQYVSKDPETQVMEFGSGPVSDFHAQGWDADDVRPEHQFLRVNGGFLGIDVKSKSAHQAEIAFTHYDVKGEITHQTSFQTDH